MPRKRKSPPTIKELEALARVLPVLLAIGIGIYLIFSITNWLHNSLGIPSEITCNIAVFTIFALIIGIPIAFVVYPMYKNEQYRKFRIEREKRLEDEQEKKFMGIQIADIDSMTGIEFEQYLQKLLTSQGYSVHMTQASGDLGVDLVASRDGDKIAIQAKRYNTRVSRHAISDAVAGMYHYDCNKTMVITSNYFSPGAVALAQSTECILIDRDTLAKWVIEFQNISDNNSIPEKPDENRA